MPHLVGLQVLRKLHKMQLEAEGNPNINIAGGPPNLIVGAMLKGLARRGWFDGNANFVDAAEFIKDFRAVYTESFHYLKEYVSDFSRVSAHAVKTPLLLLLWPFMETFQDDRRIIGNLLSVMRTTGREMTHNTLDLTLYLHYIMTEASRLSNFRENLNHYQARGTRTWSDNVNSTRCMFALLSMKARTDANKKFLDRNFEKLAFGRSRRVPRESMRATVCLNDVISVVLNNFFGENDLHNNWRTVDFRTTALQQLFGYGSDNEYAYRRILNTLQRGLSYEIDTHSLAMAMNQIFSATRYYSGQRAFHFGYLFPGLNTFTDQNSDNHSGFKQFLNDIAILELETPAETQALKLELIKARGYDGFALLLQYLEDFLVRNTREISSEEQVTNLESRYSWVSETLEGMFGRYRMRYQRFPGFGDDYEHFARLLFPTGSNIPHNRSVISSCLRNWNYSGPIIMETLISDRLKAAENYVKTWERFYGGEVDFTLLGCSNREEGIAGLEELFLALAEEQGLELYNEEGHLNADTYYDLIDIYYLTIRRGLRMVSAWQLHPDITATDLIQAYPDRVHHLILSRESDDFRSNCLAYNFIQHIRNKLDGWEEDDVFYYDDHHFTWNIRDIPSAPLLQAMDRFIANRSETQPGEQEGIPTNRPLNITYTLTDTSSTSSY